MTIKTYEYYFGSALNRLIDESNKNLEIMSFPSDSNNCFTINKKIGLFIKYTERRNTPWGFQFKKKHQERIT